MGLPLLQLYHVRHVIAAGSLSRQELGGSHSSLGKEGLGVGCVLKLDDLVLPGKDHLVLAHDGASPYSRYADLMAVSLLSLAAPVIDVLVVLLQSAVQGVRKGDGGAAGGVHLLVVVPLHDLHVKALRGQHLRRILQKLHEQIHSQGHVG